MLSTIENEILDISRNYYHYLMSLANVHGVGLGFKYVNFINTLEPSIHVLVEKKLCSRYISKNNRIPKKYMGIKTDVIETGKVKLFSSAPIKQKVRPLQGGCCISLKGGDGDGTMGCIVTKGLISKDYFILSNNHIMSEDGKDPIKGGAIMQPSYNYGGTDNDIVAYISDYIPIKVKTRIKSPVNYVDCAIAKVTNKDLISNKILNLGKIKGVNKPILNQSVKKTGFKTGVTAGYIKTIGLTEEISYSTEEIAIFKDQIILEIKAAQGDSGAIVLNGNNEAIGLLFGGIEGRNFAIMNDINTVLKKLGVSIYK